jgi:hypothetical protein
MERDKFWEGPERRRFRRYSVTDLHGVLDGEHPFELLLLSEGGMLLRMGGEARLGSTVVFDLEVPGGKIQGQARVVFLTGEPGLEQKPGRRVGLEFLELPDESRSLLHDHISGEHP